MSVLLLTPEFGNKNSELSNGRLTVYLPVFKYLENVYKISGYVSRGSLRLLENSLLQIRLVSLPTLLDK